MAVSVKFAEANKQIKINNNNTLCARDMLIIPRDIYYRLPCQSIQASRTVGKVHMLLLVVGGGCGRGAGDGDGDCVYTINRWCSNLIVLIVFNRVV